MVNPGHPSTGCATCRSRRIKCDRAYPICSRCAKSKLVCLGYDSRKPNNQRPASVSTQSQLFRPNSRSKVLLPQRVLEEQNQWSRLPKTKDHFLTIFAVAARDCTTQSADSESRLFYFNQSSFGSGVTSNLEIIKASFQSLREPTQTHEVRRKQHEKYGMALRAFREDLSSSPASSELFMAAFLFALYEMTVDIASDDSTGWQSHLLGLFTLLRQSRPAAICERLSILVTALQTLDVMVRLEMQNLEKAQLLLDIAKLQLRALNIEMDTLLNNSKGRRKIDVERVRRSVRCVHRNLTLVSSMLAKEATFGESLAAKLPSNAAPFASIPWLSDNPQHCSLDFFTLVIGNEYRTLLIITSSLLLRSGGFLHPDTTSTDYRNTREYMDLSHSIKIAVDSICSSLYSYFGNYSKISPDARSTAEVGTIEVVCTLIAMWPLYCASKARGISVHQQEWIRNVLWNIGTRARIPKAMSLAMAPTSQSESTVFSETLAGLLLVGLLWETK